MRIVDYGSCFHVFWEFDHWHKRNLEAVKVIFPNHRRFIDDKKTGLKYWWVKGEEREHVIKWRETHRAVIVEPEDLKPEVVGEVEPLPELTQELGLKGQLRPYQGQGAAAMMKWERCMNGDEQGLGKTFQSIAAAVGVNGFPCLVVCPSAAKYNWQREWHKWSDKKAMVLDAQTMDAKKRAGWFKYISSGLCQVAIVNYESVNSFCIEAYPKGKTKNGRRKSFSSTDVIPKEFMRHFKTGILDESHRCKDPSTNQSKFIGRIFVGMRYRYLLSGTPIINKPKDLWPQLAIMGRLSQVFGDVKKYEERYCQGGNGAANLNELRYLLQKNGVFFRREKKEVAKDLPEKLRQTIVCDITTRADTIAQRLTWSSGCRRRVSTRNPLIERWQPRSSSA
jgi:SWI/SNF-related matrix-associated actin-dependent regulator 1 of chromatin subfamily A